jgi:hypothetical protein
MRLNDTGRNDPALGIYYFVSQCLAFAGTNLGNFAIVTDKNVTVFDIFARHGFYVSVFNKKHVILLLAEFII